MASPIHCTRLERTRPGLTAVLLLTIVTCTDSEASERGRPQSVSVLPVLEGDMLRLSPGFADRIGMRTHKVALTEITPELHVMGVLEFDESRVAAVGSRISGRIREVRAVEGARVQVGDVLAILDSAELGTAQANVAVVEARARYAIADAQRAALLLREGIASQRAFELATQTATSTAAELRAARQRVHALDGHGPDKHLGRMPLLAPIAGDVIAVHVSRGQAVEASHTAFTIADRSTLWVRLSVFEGEVGNLRVGDRVEIATQSRPDESLTGTIAFISSFLDPATRSVEVRVVVPNEAGRLRVGQAVTARMRPDAATRRVLGVPRTALVLVDGKPTLFVAIDDTSVLPRTVEPGVESRDLVEIKRGVAAGDRVVVEGVFALKSELFR